MTERLWAPWRMAYIEGSQHGGCLFCDKAGEGADRTNLILHRGPLAFVIMNRFPYANGHLMVVPYRHCPDLAGLTPEELLDVMQTAQRCIGILRRAVRAEGFNVGCNLGRVAGAGVLEHVHLHVVPRWAGDTNFMPVLADVRVMPESLEAGYEKLLPHFHEPER